MLVGDFLRNSAARAPNRLALVGRDRRITYAEFDRMANGLANALISLELDKGAKVAILSGNCAEYAIAYFAIARTPYVSAHCSTRSTPDELTFVLNKVEAEVLFIQPRFAADIESVQAGIDRPLTIISFGPDAMPVGAVPLEEFVRDAAVDSPAWLPDGGDGLAITLTGGTTGLPKAVLVSHAARCASAVAAATEFGLHEEDIVIVSTPLFHAAGLFVWLGTAVLQGTTVVLPDAWDPLEFMKTVERERVSAALLVPSQLNELITHSEFSTKRLVTLRNMAYAGAPMSRALFDRVRSKLPDVAFTENYGQSEACPITIRCDRHGEEKFGTVGKVAINAELGIVDRDGSLLPQGETGDIVTRGEQLFDEYFNDPEETARAFRMPDGWLLTGDVGFIDKDGFLTLVDRSKDMLVSGAENVYPAEIENVLYQHDAVVECAVFGIPDAQWGEVPAAHVVTLPGVAISEQELIDFCASRIARFKRPRIVKFVTSLPKTPVGKIRKYDLRAPYWVGHDRKI